MLKEKNKSPKDLQQQKTVFKNGGERRQEWKWEEGILNQWHRMDRPEWAHTTHVIPTDPQPWSHVGKDGLCCCDVHMTLGWGRGGGHGELHKREAARTWKIYYRINARFKTRKHREGTFKTLYRQGKPTFLWIDTQSIKHNILKSANLWAYKMVLRVKSTCCESRGL